MWLLLVGCEARPECAEDETRRDGSCVPYLEGDPVLAAGWDPDPGTSWQIQYTGTLDRSVAVDAFDVDLFDTSDADFDLLRANGHHVVCYFSAGSFEDWRPDADAFPEAAIGTPLDDWEGEWWVDYTDSVVRSIMQARIQYAGERGCHAVDPDNVDAYDNNNGLGLTATMQLEYNRFLADTAHRAGLSVALKNDVDQLDALADWFDLAVNEECVVYNECDRYAGFVEAGKPVFHIEYVEDWADAESRAAEVCGRGPGLDTLVKTWELGPEFLPCPVD